MYSRAEIAMFMARLFNEIDTTIGSTISVPQGGARVTIVTKSINFWSAWMKFQEKVRGEEGVKLNIEYFKAIGHEDQPVKPIKHGTYDMEQILEWCKKNPRTTFYMAIRYKSRESEERGVFNFESLHYLN